MSCEYCTPNDFDKYSFLHDLLDEKIDCGALGKLTYSMWMSSSFEDETHKDSSLFISSSLIQGNGYGVDLFTDHSPIRYCPMCGRDLSEKVEKEKCKEAKRYEV